MHSVLINAFLSSSPDYERLFESLSWSSESWPDKERIEALTAFIEGLGPALAESDTAPFTAAKRRCIQDQIESVIVTRCLPLLWRISAESGGGARCRETTAAVCRLVSACVPLCDEAVPGRMALSVLPALQSEEDSPGPGRLSAEVASEVMAALIPSLSADEQLTLTTLSSALSCIKTLPDALISKITVRLLMTLLNSSRGARLKTIVRSVLDDLCSWHASHRTPVVAERALLCLTALSGHLLTPNGVPSASSASPCEHDPRLSLQFWRIVQDGLTHRDSVSRKRALYLLKRCVALSEEEGLDCPPSPSVEGKCWGWLTFFNLWVHWYCLVCFTFLATVADETLFKWAPNKSKLLREFWEDYALVMETLEENQVENSLDHNKYGKSSSSSWHNVIMIPSLSFCLVCRFMLSDQFWTE